MARLSSLWRLRMINGTYAEVLCMLIEFDQESWLVIFPYDLGSPFILADNELVDYPI